MADKPTIPDFPNLPDFGQMITQACEVVASVRGIPYDFNGTLSLENKFVILFKTVKEMFDAQDALVKSYKELYEFINTYFDNLDVQEEVNKKIQSMVDDGRLLTLIAPTVASNTSSWLHSNITNPSNPPIDKSLSVENAAADAFTTGFYTTRKAIRATEQLGITTTFQNGNLTISLKNGKNTNFVWSERLHYSTEDIDAITLPAQTETIIVWLTRVNKKTILNAAYESLNLYIPKDAIIIYIAFTNTTSIVYEVLNIDTVTTNNIDATLTIRGKAADSFITGQYTTRLAIAATREIGLDITFQNGNITFRIKKGAIDNFVWSEHSYIQTNDIQNITIPASIGTIVAYFLLENRKTTIHALYENRSGYTIPASAIIFYIGFTNTSSIITEIFNIDNINAKAKNCVKTPGIYNKKIVLGGDSITHGVGGTGWSQNGRTIITVDGTTWKESPNSYSWANLLIKLLTEQYNCTVTNNGCTGTTSDFWATNINTLLPVDTDLFILTIGTNDRNLATIEKCRQNILTSFPVIKRYCADHDIRLCVFSPIPASQNNEDSKQAKTWQINEWLREICFIENIEYYNLHDYIYNWYFSKGEPIGTYADGLHPNDLMYYYMFYAYCILLDIAPGLPVPPKP